MKKMKNKMKKTKSEVIFLDPRADPVVVLESNCSGLIRWQETQHEMPHNTVGCTPASQPEY